MLRTIIKQSAGATAITVKQLHRLYKSIRQRPSRNNCQAYRRCSLPSWEISASVSVQIEGFGTRSRSRHESDKAALFRHSCLCWLWISSCGVPCGTTSTESKEMTDDKLQILISWMTLRCLDLLNAPSAIWPPFWKIKRQRLDCGSALPKAKSCGSVMPENSGTCWPSPALWTVTAGGKCHPKISLCHPKCQPTFAYGNVVY